MHVHLPTESSEYINQKLKELKIDKSTIILRDLKTPLPATDTTNRSITSKDIGDLRNITELNLMNFMEHSTHKQQNMPSVQVYSAYL